MSGQNVRTNFKKSYFYFVIFLQVLRLLPGPAVEEIQRLPPGLQKSEREFALATLLLFFCCNLQLANRKCLLYWYMYPVISSHRPDMAGSVADFESGKCLIVPFLHASLAHLVEPWFVFCETQLSRNNHDETKGACYVFEACKRGKVRYLPIPNLA